MTLKSGRVLVSLLSSQSAHLCVDNDGSLLIRYVDKLLEMFSGEKWQAVVPQSTCVELLSISTTTAPHIMQQTLPRCGISQASNCKSTRSTGMFFRQGDRNTTPILGSTQQVVLLKTHIYFN